MWNWHSGKLLEELGGEAPRVSFDASFFSCCDNFTFLSFDGAEGSERLWARNENTTTLWDVHLDQKTPDELDEFVAPRVPWRVKQGRLVLPEDEMEP